MSRSQLRFLSFRNAGIALAILAIAALAPACSSVYRHMKPAVSGDECLRSLRPVIGRNLYKTSVDVLGHHLSGILLMRTMPDSSLRLVFGNETGFGFFDFGFDVRDSFTVYSIIPQLRKKAIIKTLRKDFELILFRKMDPERRFLLLDSGLRYYGYPQTKGINYYVTDSSCGRLIKMQRASSRKPVMEAVIEMDGQNSPDSILIRHLNFAFEISLKKTDQRE